jgi:hypothetical protein
MLGFVADLIVAVLLVATIGYATVLNRRLAVLRGDRAQLETLIEGLTVATQRAEGGVAGLRAAAEDTGRQLEKRIEQAQGLRDDITYMLERGTAVADRLETTIRARREEPKPEPRPERRVEPRVEPRPERIEPRVQRRAEPRVEPVAPRAAEPPRAPEPLRAPEPPRVPERPRAAEPPRASELPRVLQMLRARGEGKPAAAPTEGELDRRAGLPSRAERDLLRALGGRR